MGFTALYFTVTCLGMRLTAIGLNQETNMTVLYALSSLPTLVCLYRLGHYCDRIWNHHAMHSVMALLNITVKTVWYSACIWTGGLIARVLTVEPAAGQGGGIMEAAQNPTR